MTQPDERFHATWLGMVQPSEGLVVSIPVLLQAQCAERQDRDVQSRLAGCLARTADGAPHVEGVERVLRDVLGYPPEAIGVDGLDRWDLFIPEGRQVLKATGTLRDPAKDGVQVLLWELPEGLDLDRPETVTGTWEYPPTAKFDRLLRHGGVPIGILTNRRDFRLVYAPAGEATGTLTFRLDDMLSVGGRPVLDAFVMLLSAHRLYEVAAERALPRLLEDSRRWQATVSVRLASQVLDAAGLLLEGFEVAAARDGTSSLAEALEVGGDHVHRGLLTALLRIVFLLYAEDSGLMPVDHPLYASGLSVTQLFDDLRADAGAYPDSMSNRFGAWDRLIGLFRSVFLGAAHGDLVLPPRRGTLFDPHRFPFLEGWTGAGTAPIVDPVARAEVPVPTLSDATVLAVLERLIMLDGQRISYRSLDVEQIGSVYESMLGYTVLRLDGDGVCVRGSRRWITAEEVLRVPAARRARWLKDEVDVTAANAERVARGLNSSKNAAAAFAVLQTLATKGADGGLLTRSVGRLVLQPRQGTETSTAHYTPRSLCRPLVARTLEPLLRSLGPSPTAAQLLSLKICDPAMGSGAFLVEACRFLADQLVAAWRREGHESVTRRDIRDPLVVARRIVAQRCLYGVDRSADAVELAKLSLWLVTLARDLPFTFVDHALRHGDSIVGLDLDQITSFHWHPGDPELFLSGEVKASLAEALPIRERIEELASADAPEMQEEKQRLLWDAEDAIERLRTVGDLVLAAYFGGATAAERKVLRERYLQAVSAWLHEDKPLPPEVLDARRTLRETIPAFHWAIEMPEVFHTGRRDPLEPGSDDPAARMDAFAGTMPFIGGRRNATIHGERYAQWLCDAYESTGEVDYVAYFFLRANQLLGRAGTMGFIATSSIAQGDTRRMGLQRLLADGLVIYDAQSKVPWPGDAGVMVAPVLLAKGVSRDVVGEPRMNGLTATTINSRLRTYAERDDPKVLEANSGVALVGCFLRGDGFVLSKEEAADLVAKDPGSGAVVRPYLVGEDVTKDPAQQASRCVIDFATMDLKEASLYKAAMAVIEERVRPDRERLKTSGADASHRKFWWRFANTRNELRAWLSQHGECLVLPRVAKHLLVARVPADHVFSEQVVIFTVASMTAFAVLQSRVHETWVRLLSSTMGDGLRYSATDCFDTFPFPRADPRTVIPALEAVGAELERARARYMVAEGVGLTTTYNRLKDPSVDETRIVELRRVHERLDRAVLDAYAEADPTGRWTDVNVAPYRAVGDAQAASLPQFEDGVIGRLFVLNAKRADDR